MAKRVRVIRKTDRVYLGSMVAQVGMTTKEGAIIEKVNDKSVVINGNRIAETMSIFLDEARKWGFKN